MGKSLEIALSDMFEQYAEQLENDEELKVELNKFFADKCDPYVPYITGALANTVTIDKDGITYEQPYASDVYESARPHNTEVHPLASSRWDDVAFANHRDEIEAKATELIGKRLKELIK